MRRSKNKDHERAVEATYKITSVKGVGKKVAISGKKKVKAGKTLKLSNKSAYKYDGINSNAKSLQTY